MSVRTMCVSFLNIVCNICLCIICLCVVFVLSFRTKVCNIRTMCVSFPHVYVNTMGSQQFGLPTWWFRRIKPPKMPFPRPSLHFTSANAPTNVCFLFPTSNWDHCTFGSPKNLCSIQILYTNMCRGHFRDFSAKKNVHHLGCPQNSTNLHGATM